jgi:hypothetical protein
MWFGWFGESFQAQKILRTDRKFHKASQVAQLSAQIYALLTLASSQISLPVLAD